MQDRTRRGGGSLVLLASLLALFLLAAPAANAAKLGGKTVLAPNTDTLDALSAAGVSVAPTGDAKLGKNGLVFPITNGKVDLDKGKAKINHSGGLEFASHGTALTLENFTIKVGAKNVLKAEVAGADGAKVRLANLNLKKAKIKEKGNRVVISNVGVSLARTAAKALSQTFGLPNLAGADLGVAKVKAQP
ncbi:MAG: HtaA domain-containing protein [Solirubrobacterales bacterium]